MKIILVVLLIVIGIALFLANEKLTLLRPGNRAPGFEGINQAGDTIRLSEFLGRRNVILYFYPGDFTAGCTAEACAFRDYADSLKPLDAIIIGVSMDDETSHRRFSSKYNLPFALLTDHGGRISRSYHTLWLGGLLPYPKRVTYVIDKRGVIFHVIRHEVNVSRIVPEALQALRRDQAREE